MLFVRAEIQYVKIKTMYKKKTNPDRQHYTWLN